ncbi:hypothetical protein ACH5RR_013390 [Cinchona calisaya]|uniref:Uncharacterized protein n=1 Tax=Cinchona calisaya TaxID=153742 RepID=A0ABD3A5M1_9GENT
MYALDAPKPDDAKVSERTELNGGRDSEAGGECKGDGVSEGGGAKLNGGGGGGASESGGDCEGDITSKGDGASECGDAKLNGGEEIVIEETEVPEE